MKVFIIAIALLATSMTGWGQTIDDVFNRFQNQENVTFLNLSKDMIRLGMSSSDDPELVKLSEQIDGMKVLALENSSPSLKKELREAFGKFNFGEYQEVIKVNSEGEKVKILTKGTENEVNSLIIFVLDDEDCTLVKIDGHVNPKEIDKIVESQTK